MGESSLHGGCMGASELCMGGLYGPVKYLPNSSAIARCRRSTM